MKDVYEQLKKSAEVEQAAESAAMNAMMFGTGVVKYTMVDGEMQVECMPVGYEYKPLTGKERLLKEEFIAKDSNGRKLSNALMYILISPTSTLAPTYSDELLETPNCNPIVADCEGEFKAVYAPKGLYKITLLTCEGESVFTQDDIVV